MLLNLLILEVNLILSSFFFKWMTSNFITLSMFNFIRFSLLEDSGRWIVAEIQEDPTSSVIFFVSNFFSSCTGMKSMSWRVGVGVN